MRLFSFLLFSLLAALVSAHARIKTPKPLNAPPEDPTGNAYNAPLSGTGADFPCKGLHKQSGVDQTPTQSWAAGSPGLFEILGHVTPTGEGALAAHSGGSCQASISFDKGVTWRVLHTYHGGCPRDVPLNSNMAGPNQKFAFNVPAQTKAGPALFSWTWIAVSGNRDEFYMNCAAVSITGSGTSTLDDFPNMYVGEMNIPGQISTGECRSTAGTAMLYPNPGPADRITVTEVAGIPFKLPTTGKCFAPGGAPQAPPPGSSTVPVAPTTMATSTLATPTSTPTPTAVAPPPPPPPSPTSSYVAPPVAPPATTSTYPPWSYTHPHRRPTTTTTTCTDDVEPTTYPVGNTYASWSNRRRV